MSTTDAVYTHGHHDSVLRSHRWRTPQNSAAYLLPHLQPGMSLLDVGAGPATITAGLAEILGPGIVTATEVTPDALEVTKSATEASGRANIETTIADVHKLPFPDDSFDVVHAHQVLQHVGDPVQALREMRRVCKPGGIVAARDSDYEAFTWFPEVPELTEWKTLYRKLARANGGEPDAGRMLLSWAKAAGFERVDASASVWCHADPESRDYWGGMWADRIVQSQMAKQAVDSGGKTADDLQRISDGWRRWAASDDGWYAILHGEILAYA